MTVAEGRTGAVVEAIELEPIVPKQGLTVTWAVGAIILCFCLFHLGVIVGLFVWQ